MKLSLKNTFSLFYCLNYRMVFNVAIKIKYTCYTIVNIAGIKISSNHQLFVFVFIDRRLRELFAVIPWD